MVYEKGSHITTDCIFSSYEILFEKNDKQRVNNSFTRSIRHTYTLWCSKLWGWTARCTANRANWLTAAKIISSLRLLWWCAVQFVLSINSKGGQNLTYYLHHVVWFDFDIFYTYFLIKSLTIATYQVHFLKKIQKIQKKPSSFRLKSVSLGMFILWVEPDRYSIYNIEE